MIILLSGFDPFDGSLTNPSKDLMLWLQDQDLPCEVKTVVLPVTFGEAYKKLITQIDLFKPDIVIATGLAADREKITPERIAVNWMDGRIPDNDGVKPNPGKICEDGADGIFTRLDVDWMVRVFESAGVPSSVSLSAGSYVCNHVFYQLLKNTRIPAGFIHIPPLDKARVFDGFLALVQAIHQRGAP